MMALLDLQSAGLVNMPLACVTDVGIDDTLQFSKDVVLSLQVVVEWHWLQSDQ